VKAKKRFAIERKKPSFYFTGSIGSNS